MLLWHWGFGELCVATQTVFGFETVPERFVNRESVAVVTDQGFCSCIYHVLRIRARTDR